MKLLFKSSSTELINECRQYHRFHFELPSEISQNRKNNFTKKITADRIVVQHDRLVRCLNKRLVKVYGLPGNRAFGAPALSPYRGATTINYLHTVIQCSLSRTVYVGPDCKIFWYLYVRKRI